MATREPCDYVLHSNHYTGILVPAQQRIIAVFCSRLRNICSASHEVFV